MNCSPVSKAFCRAHSVSMTHPGGAQQQLFLQTTQTLQANRQVTVPDHSPPSELQGLLRRSDVSLSAGSSAAQGPSCDRNVLLCSAADDSIAMASRRSSHERAFECASHGLRGSAPGVRRLFCFMLLDLDHPVRGLHQTILGSVFRLAGAGLRVTSLRRQRAVLRSCWRSWIWSSGILPAFLRSRAQRPWWGWLQSGTA